jgi:hypothetical protein
MDSNGLRTFQDLKDTYTLPGNSFFYIYHVLYLLPNIVSGWGRRIQIQKNVLREAIHLAAVIKLKINSKGYLQANRQGKYSFIV